MTEDQPPCLPRFVAARGSMTPADARDAILAGRTVRKTVGTHRDDPTLLLYLDDGMVYSQSVAGWSNGHLEPLCASDSDYLLESLTRALTLTLEPEDSWD